MPTRPPRGAGQCASASKFDPETWHALHQLSLGSMRSLQELADEAFRDLLKKASPADHPERNAGRALVHPANDHGPARKRGA
jgi:hypothetical protein